MYLLDLVTGESVRIVENIPGTINILLYRHLLGRIPIRDYWAGNTEMISELGWIDAKEFLEKRIRIS